MAIKITKKVRGKMYACFAFFPDESVKKWKYVTDLQSFASFLNQKHAGWKYFNVYDKETKGYLKRFYPNNSVPKVLPLLLLVLLTQKFTFNKTTFTSSLNPNLENTTFSKTTFTNDFNYCATIPTPLACKKGVLCS